jgi:hypothetical protein
MRMRIIYGRMLRIIRMVMKNQRDLVRNGRREGRKTTLLYHVTLK